MKGFIIFEDFKKLINCKEILDGDYNCVISDYPNDTFSGIINRVTGARCNKDDTYDFETGALIALMKMCGRNKALKAVEELYFLKEPRGADLDGDILESKAEYMAKENKELKEENESLNYKYNLVKAGHDYWKSRCVLLNSRQNGKQYTFLSNLFKGMPKDKVDAAYKEAYDKWIKLPSPRERMWDDILKEGRTPVYVKREDIHAFLEECQVTGIKWATGKMPLETMPFHMSKGYDGIYFFVMTTLDISKSTPGVKEFRHVMCWWMTASDEEARNSVKYIAPMRWDLFEKGRIYIRVKAEHFEEFKKACKAHLEKEPLSPFTYYSNGDVIVCYTDGHFRLTKTLNGFKKRPIINWEDVR